MSARGVAGTKGEAGEAVDGSAHRVSATADRATSASRTHARGDGVDRYMVSSKWGYHFLRERRAGGANPIVGNPSLLLEAARLRTTVRCH
jgi:hypothetical protein